MSGERYLVQLPAGRFTLELQIDASVPDGYAGWVSVEHRDGDLHAVLGMAPALFTEQIGAQFMAWAVTRIERLVRPDGSEPDVWHRNPAGHLVVYAPLDLLRLDAL